jgi:hypothetical protein
LFALKSRPRRSCCALAIISSNIAQRGIKPFRTELKTSIYALHYP